MVESDSGGKFSFRNIPRPTTPTWEKPSKPEYSLEEFGLEKDSDTEELLKSKIPTIDESSWEISKEENNSISETRSPEKERPSEIPIYFLKFNKENSETGTELVRVLRKLPSNVDVGIYALKELQKGPTKEERQRGIVSAIPKRFSILDSKRNKNGIYYLKLSEDFQANGSPSIVRDRLDQLTYTILESTTSTKLKLSLGEESVAAGMEDGDSFPEYLKKSNRRILEF